MKYMKTEQMKVICETEPELFEKKFNEYMTYLAKEHAEYTLHYNDNAGLCVYINAIFRTLAPEDERERRQLEGKARKCKECPMWVNIQPTDKRKKYVECEWAEFGICQAERECCDHFYEWQEKGGDFIYHHE